MLAQVLKYEALSLGLMHNKARPTLPMSEHADPTPAIDGPNPFAASKPERRPSDTKLGATNLHKPAESQGEAFFTFCPYMLHT